MQTTVMQVAIQVATVEVVALKEAYTRPTTGANMTSSGEAQCLNSHQCNW